MKLFSTILVFLSLFANGQKVSNYCKHNAITWSCMFVAGAADGFAESWKFHPVSTANKLNLHGGYWVSDGLNKYKHRDPKQGYVFPGSSTIGVGLTDVYHGSRTLRNVAVCAGIAFKIGQRQKWYMYLLDFATASVVYSVGFNSIYEYLK